MRKFTSSFFDFAMLSPLNALMAERRQLVPHAEHRVEFLAVIVGAKVTWRS
jgi:hypothetical protein